MKKVPKYMMIYSDIKKKISDEFYRVGHKLPSGYELSDEYNASKLTVKKAIDLLISEGLLIAKSGYGTEVISNCINKKVFGPNDGLFNVVGEKHVESVVHTFSVSLPESNIAEKLNIPSNEYIYHIIRSRFLDKRPYSIEETYLPKYILPNLTMQDLSKSVYTYLKKNLHLTFSTKLLRIKGVLATSRDSSLLTVNEGDFMIEVEKYAQLSDGRPIEYSITKHVYNNFIFEVDFS